MAGVALTWLGHAAFRFDTPAASGSTSTRSSTTRVPGGRARARARRPDRDHARPRRPRRRRVELAKRFDSPGRRASSSSRLARRSRASRTPPTLRPEQGRHGRRRRHQVHVDERPPLEQHFEDGQSSTSASPAASSIELENGTKLYFAGDTVRLRRHAADRPDLRARRRDPPDRRPLHDGPARGRRRARAARREALPPVPLGHLPAADGHARRAPRARARTSRSSRPSRGDDRADERGALVRRDGRRVPEIALEGDRPCRSTRRSCSTTSPTRTRLRDGARARARPWSCAPRPPRGAAALARPEVASVLVPPPARDLLELDLTALTYGD